MECEERNRIPGCWVRGRKLTWLSQGLAIERKGLVQGGYLGRTEGYLSLQRCPALVFSTGVPSLQLEDIRI